VNELGKAPKKKKSSAPSLEFERGAGFPLSPVIGVDEVGRGCLAGPVVAAAVILPTAWDLPRRTLVSRFRPIAEITDSKMLSQKEREALAPWICANVKAFGIGSASVEEIDTINIFHASHLAMERAAQALLARLAEIGEPFSSSSSVAVSGFVNAVTNPLLNGSPAGDLGLASSEPPSSFPHVLVDGNAIPRVFRPNATAIVKGDLRCLSIACASIIAKVHRDEGMRALAETHPGFGFEIHKGYATPMHRKALESLGLTPAHRRSFAPVRERAELETMQLDLLEPDFFQAES
jgi:ribonuclease HII